MTPERPHLTSQTLDLMLLGALPEAEQGEARAHLKSCTNCGQLWEQMQVDKAQFEQFVLPRTRENVTERLAKRPLLDAFRFKWLLPVVGLAAAVAIGVIANNRVAGGTETEDEVYIGVKGGGGFVVYAKRGEEQPFVVNDGMKLKPHDKLAFAIKPGKFKQLIIASMDGANTFNVYFPYGADKSTWVRPSEAPVELPGSIEIDATPGTEHLYAVLSEEPFSVDEVKKAVEANRLAPSIPGAVVTVLKFDRDLP